MKLLNAKTLIPAVLGSMLLLSSLQTQAAPVMITANGTVTEALGTMSGMMGQSVSVSFLIDLDPLTATHVDTDDSDNPHEEFTSIYTFANSDSSWTASASGGPTIGSEIVSILTENNILEPGENGGNPFDAIDIWGSIVTPVCSTGGPVESCDPTDLDPDAGIEIGLTLIDETDWFSGNDLPTSIPNFMELLFGEIWGAEFAAGNEIGELTASLDGMTVQPVTAVPVPAAVWLFGSGLLGLIGFSKRKKAA